MNFSQATIGVNADAIQSYLTKIKSEVIESAKGILDSKQEELFEVFRNNWRGQSEENFEAIISASTNEIKVVLDGHYDALQGKIIEILNAWLKQDSEMIDKGGIL